MHARRQGGAPHPRDDERPGGTPRPGAVHPHPPDRDRPHRPDQGVAPAVPWRVRGGAPGRDAAHALAELPRPAPGPAGKGALSSMARPKYNPGMPLWLTLGIVLLPAAASADAPLRSIGFLVLPGVYNSELMAPYDVLHHLRFHVKDAPEVFTVAPRAGAIRTYEGLWLQPAYSFENAPAIDLLVVPSAEHNMDSDLRDAALLKWVKEAGGKARYVMSLCDGAFVLAKAGLLDGLEATTFPGD